MPRTTKDPLMQALYEAAKGPGSMDIHTILDAADRLSEQQQVIDELRAKIVRHEDVYTKVHARMQKAETLLSQKQKVIDELVMALDEIVIAGTRQQTVRTGDMHDETGGYNDFETFSDEAIIASEALISRAKEAGK